VEDWAQDLLIHLRYLPAASKHREAGKEDIVQTFDPCKHHGANSARFFNYINLCLGNRFRTMYSARMKTQSAAQGMSPSAGTLMRAIPGRWTTSSATRTRHTFGGCAIVRRGGGMRVIR
jgi:hypothetical protein